VKGQMLELSVTPRIGQIWARVRVNSWQNEELIGCEYKITDIQRDGRLRIDNMDMETYGRVIPNRLAIDFEYVSG
jgi:hypothetical protein